MEQILGSIVKPLKVQFEDQIGWLWITRYVGAYNSTRPPLGYTIPEEYHSNNLFRYVLFRASVEDQQKNDFHNRAIALDQNAHCFTNPRGWIRYDVVSDLGNARFMKPNATDNERVKRARLIAYFVNSTIELMINSLVNDEAGRWALEMNADLVQNPEGNFFQSIHHLLCNDTSVPTLTLVTVQQDNLLVTTPIALTWNAVISVPLPSENHWYKVPIRF